jgi:hypothetical protein
VFTVYQRPQAAPKEQKRHAMRSYTCDRCKKNKKPEEKSWLAFVTDRAHQGTELTIDLCPVCAKGLHDWLCDKSLPLAETESLNQARKEAMRMVIVWVEFYYPDSELLRRLKNHPYSK